MRKRLPSSTTIVSMRPERPCDEPPDLIVVGEAMVDVRAPAVRPGQRSHGSISLRAGGTAVNAALAAASIGARVCVVGRVGDDGAGRLVRDALEAAGVECGLVLDGQSPDGHFRRGRRLDRRRPGANAALTIDDIPRPLRASAVLLSPYLPDELARAVAGAAEARWVAGPDGNVYIGHDPPEAGYEVVCTTLGEDGALAVRGAAREFRAPPAAVAGSATGAGDAFAAGFLVELARGKPLGACLELGCSLGYAAAANGVEA